MILIVFFRRTAAGTIERTDTASSSATAIQRSAEFWQFALPIVCYRVWFSYISYIPILQLNVPIYGSFKWFYFCDIVFVQSPELCFSQAGRWYSVVFLTFMLSLPLLSSCVWISSRFTVFCEVPSLFELNCTSKSSHQSSDRRLRPNVILIYAVLRLFLHDARLGCCSKFLTF